MKRNKKFLSGKFLVASPSMTDPRFFKSVIYIIMHKSEGAMGIVINQPIIETKINNIINNEELKDNSNIDNIPITYGGPVDTKKDLYYIPQNSRTKQQLKLIVKFF